MNTILFRILLLLLLGVDWAMDPCWGTSPLSMNLTSTEVVPLALQHQAALARACIPPAGEWYLGLALGELLDFALLTTLASPSHRASVGQDLVYLLMTLRC